MLEGPARQQLQTRVLGAPHWTKAAVGEVIERLGTALQLRCAERCRAASTMQRLNMANEVADLDFWAQR